MTMKKTERITSFFGMGDRKREVLDQIPTEEMIAAWVPEIARETDSFVKIRYPQEWFVTWQSALLICERLKSLGYRVVSGEMGICEKVRPESDQYEYDRLPD